MTVESKIKDAPRGAPFILFSRALVPVMYWLEWSEVWWELWLVTSEVTSEGWIYPRHNWYFEFTPRLKEHHLHEWLSPGFLLQSIYTNDFDIYELFQAHEWFIHTNWSITDSVQWVPVTMLTIALIVRTIDFYTHFSKNTNLETETSLPII